MKKIIMLCLLAVGMIACTEKNTPTNPGGETTTDTTSVSPGDTTIVTTDTIQITWNGAAATVTGEHSGVIINQDNGYVTITSTVKDITYLLSGNGQGQLTIFGTNRHQLIMRDLTLVCSDGSAINNQCKKSCFVVLEGTNSLTDGSSYTSSADSKAAFFSEGQIIMSGAGSLSIKGNYKHALASDDYIQFVESTGALTLQASADGIHANDGIYFDGGTYTITAGNDGVQCDSVIIVNNGSLSITAEDKGITDSLGITINGGTIRVSSKYKCIKTKANLVINGGDIEVVCTGTASSGGGGPWGWGGDSSSSSPEGIEAKGTITINGGFIYTQSADDAINSGSDFTINGGCLCAYSTGNDGIDANGNCYIKGGLIYAIGSRSPEVAIDANTEQRYKLYVQGGTIVAIGNLESGASLSQPCYKATGATNTWYAVETNGEVFAFKTPSSNASTIIVSGATQPKLYKGVSASGTAIFKNMGYYPATYTGGNSVNLSTYTSSSSGGPGGGGPGGW